MPNYRVKIRVQGAGISQVPVNAANAGAAKDIVAAQYGVNYPPKTEADRKVTILEANKVD